ncbi:MAG TPA: ABC transporter transmembrane domain-containing protein, partial [Candidatus Dormibacteraeota bacterium]
MGMMPPHQPDLSAMMWLRGRRKSPQTGTADSGLTGDPMLEGPPKDEGPKDLRGRWENLKQAVIGTTAALPRVLRLVWDASPRITLALFAATIVAGVIPAGAAYTSKLLINAVVRGILIHNTGIPNAVSFHDLDPNLHGGPSFTAINMIVVIALLQLALFAITALLGTIRNITQQLLQNSVAMRIQVMVMEKAASLDLSFYEDPASYDLLRRAQTDSINRPVLMISTAFGLLQTLLTFITMIALLIVVSPLLALLALVSPIPAFIADTRYGWRGYAIARWGSRLLRRMNYMVTLVTTDSYAKEVKLFGLGNYFIERYRIIADRYYSSQRAQVTRRYLTGFALGNISTVATSITYLYVALQAIFGRLTLGDLSLYTAAAASVQGSIQGILGG